MFIQKLDITNKNIARQVLALQKEAYLHEAKLINYYTIPLLADDLAALQNSGEVFYGYAEKDKLCGIVSFKQGGILDIHRLAVHPHHFKKGIGSALVEFILVLAIEHNQKVIVQTAEKNYPALQLYAKYGFRVTGNQKIDDTLTLVKLEL